jgi:hypothetical protein
MMLSLRQFEPKFLGALAPSQARSTFRRLPAEQTTGIDWRKADGTWHECHELIHWQLPTIIKVRLLGTRRQSGTVPGTVPDLAGDGDAAPSPSPICPESGTLRVPRPRPRFGGDGPGRSAPRPRLGFPSGVRALATTLARRRPVATMCTTASGKLPGLRCYLVASLTARVSRGGRRASAELQLVHQLEDQLRLRPQRGVLRYTVTPP